MSHCQPTVLFLLNVQSLSIFLCKEYNQSDFSIDHLVMSVCRVFSLLEEGVCYDQCIVQAKLYQPLPCFILYSKALPTCLHLLTSYFCIPVPYDEKDSFFWCQLQNVLQVFIEPFYFSFFSIVVWGINLDYCDIEWFTLETNRDNSVVFEIASKYCISDSVFDYKGYSFSSKGSLATVVVIMVISIKFTHSSPFQFTDS